MQLDHFTIRTANLAATRAFFLEVFDHLEEKPRLGTIQRIPGHWLYAGEEPIVHIIGAYGQGFDGAPEVCDHMAFGLERYDAFRAKLIDLNIPYSPMELPELNEQRLFFRVPGGPVIEVVFRENQVTKD